MVVVKRDLTTAEAADAIGINRVTLQEWIRTGRVKAPEVTLRDGHSIRLWSREDVRELREIKHRTYRRGRGRKARIAPRAAEKRGAKQ